MTAPRYALYFTPAPSSPWRAFGAAWLGRCALDAGWREQARIEGMDAAALRRLTEAPARYGFHATLKAPFHLAAGCTASDLATALDRFCADQEAFALPPLQAQRIKHFLALVLPAPEARLDAISAGCVTQFDRFRAPASPRELERRRLADLSLRQEALLLRWGYPHVLDQFQFHFSLTGALGDLPVDSVESVLAAARAQIDALRDALRDAPLMFDAISLFEEPAPGAPFRVLQRSALRAPRGRLIYLVGPSGAGKDSLIGYVQRHLPSDAPVRFAQRVITREAAPDGEAHAAATSEEFVRREACGEFAMVWRANGQAYGITREILAWLGAGDTVVVNGSRAHAAQAIAQFPRLELVLIDAGPAKLRQRLLARGRESVAAIEARLARNPQAGAGLVACARQIRNDGELETAGAQLLELVLQPASPLAAARVAA